jgi:lipoprotein-anchoring transpeptidase ErfK/SrfK
MRPTVLVVLLSTLVFAQDAGQQAAQIAGQAAQTAVQQNQQAQQQAIQNAQQQNDAALRVHQQAMAPNVTYPPSFSPKPGTFQGAIPPVTITDATKDAVIYFTTDGSTPTLKSQRYTAPISLSATTTLKAMAIGPSFAKSPSVRGKYVVK